MKYKVTYTTTHTVFQIDNFVKSLSCLSSCHICEEMCFIFSQNLEVGCHESVTLADIALTK